MPSSFSIGRWIGLTILFSLPGLLVLAGLAIWAGLDRGSAAAAGLIVVCAIGALTLIYYRDASSLRRYLQLLNSSSAPAEKAPDQPKLGSEAGRNLLGEIVRLRRSWLQRESRLEQGLSNLNQVIDALDDPLLIINGNRTVARANESSIQLFGEAPDGRDVSVMLRHPDVLASLDATLADGRPRSLEITQPVPVEQAFEVRIVPLRELRTDTGQGEPAEAGPAAVVTFHDITSLKRSEQLRADFVANASHELRTPLSALVGFIETLRGPAREDAEARDRFLGIMDEQAHRMTRLVSDLMSLSRIEQDEHTPPVEPISLVPVIKGVIDGLELTARERKMPIRFHVPDTLPTVYGDADQLAQVFQNLLDNALKYGREDTEITVAARVERTGRRRSLAISVADRGQGIEKDHIPRLTERFFRVDPARSRSLGGTGLGLAIVKHIVSRHRGRFAVESTLGEGSTFTVYLPIAASAKGVVEAPQQTAAL